MVLALKGESATLNLAEQIGRNLHGGEVIELAGDLGAGKTTFVKGLARGAGSDDHVTSPSFTIRNDYTAKEHSIAHFDFYRLSDPGIAKEMLAEEVIDPETTVVVEWAGVVDDILPEDHIEIAISSTDENERELKIDCPDRFRYLFNGVTK